MANKKGRPPMVKNYAQNQTHSGGGNAMGVLARPSDDGVPSDEGIPENGIEHLRNNRVRIYWRPVDHADMDKKGEIKQTIVDEKKWIEFYDPDYCPRTVIHMYPDFVTEQPKSLMRSQDPGQEAGLGVYHQHLLYAKAEQENFIKEHEQRSPERMSQFVDEISSEWSEDQLVSLKKKLDALDLEVKTSSGSSSSSDSS